jgi:Domain of unknown function (DUF4911)
LPIPAAYISSGPVRQYQIYNPPWQRLGVDAATGTCYILFVETINWRYRIDRREIAFFKFILEAYEGIAVLTTNDARQGMVSVRVAPGCEDVVRAVIDDLKQNILIEPLI